MSELDAVATDLAPTGTLRAAINVGNPVLAQGDPADPSGVTVDLARRLGEQLGLPVELTGFTAARQSFEAMRDGAADLCFLAVDPARAGGLGDNLLEAGNEGDRVLDARLGMFAERPIRKPEAATEGVHRAIGQH